jgi:uncharacterized repeat protein (TIGR01451 family)
MRRIAVAALMLAALAGAYWSCSTDAPAPTPPTTPPGNPTPGASPLVITLFTTDANPAAGGCTLVQAIVTFNGKAVADGIGVSFSTDFGVFAQNSQPVVSITTTKGSAIAVLCSASSGTAFVNATATVSGVTAKADPLKITFQSASVPAPFFSNCNPNFGANTGGTALTIAGGRFPGSAATTKATFTAAGITREALVTAVTPTAVTLTTPAFPEAVSPSVPVTITLTFLTNSGSPVTLTVPNCFAFGTAGSGTPTITALLPSSGSKDGNTRVSIIGAGFSAPLQVFFVGGAAPVEVQVISVSFNQIVILTPPAFQFGAAPPINTPLDVRVHEVTSGTDATLVAGWTYTLPLVITGISPLQMRSDQIVSLTIFGHGFQSPVLVTIGGARAIVQSVSDSEILVVPVLSGCSGGGGGVTVTNLNTGETASSPQSLTITSITPSISGINPTTGAAGSSVTISGTNLPTTTALARVLFGTQQATVVSASADGITLVVTVPPPPAGTVADVCPVGTPPGTLLPPAGGGTVGVTVQNLGTGCTSNSASFGYLLPCGVADLALSKSGPASVAVNGSVTYTLTITNPGGAAAANVALTDPLPAGTTFVSCTPTQGTCSGGATVNAALGTVPAGGTASVTIQITVQGVPRSMTNTANVTTTTTEPNLGNNSASATTAVTP